MTLHEKNIKRCLELAELGRPFVTPNPMVGAVIVHQGEIIAEGYHEKYGGAHAEVNAINKIEHKEILKQSTIYVSLEPCAHFGKTPPCADLIVAMGFKNAVIGTLDPNPLVSGKGIERLMNAGIHVTVGVLEEKCKSLNRKFFTFFEKKRPHFTLKWAQTKNGFIDDAKLSTGRNWISSPESQVFVHQLRSEHDAILVGYRTVIADNPSLTVRRIDGRNPTRLVLDPKNELGIDHHLFSNEAITKKIVLESSNPSQNDIVINEVSSEEISRALFENKIQSVLVEGGTKTLELFLSHDLWDDILIIVGQNEFEDGTKAPILNINPDHIENNFGDSFNYYVK